MLPKNIIKETLSRNFIEIIAGRNGHKYNTPTPDNGVDISILQSVEIERNGKNIFMETGARLDVQLKSTTSSSVSDDGNFLKYRLRGKNYNDLIFRLDTLTPLYLIIFILPEDESEWVEIEKDSLVLRKRAYWYKPPHGASIIAEKAKKTLSIPLDQTVNLDFLDLCFTEAYK